MKYNIDNHESRHDTYYLKRWISEEHRGMNKTYEVQFNVISRTNNATYDMMPHFMEHLVKVMRKHQLVQKRHVWISDETNQFKFSFKKFLEQKMVFYKENVIVGHAVLNRQELCIAFSVREASDIFVGIETELIESIMAFRGL